MDEMPGIGVRLAYYNENDPKAAAWLRELITQGLIANGVVDERSIHDVRGDDLRSYTQCHFFAGIGGWSYALRLAGWSDARSVWTGSCPCQPFSAAGKRRGTADERHLWPDFHRLIAECGPAIVFGEQIASRDGREWLAGVRSDLEALGYGVGGADLCAAGVGAPHIRQRLYWMAERLEQSARIGRIERRAEPSGRSTEPRCEIGGVGDADDTRLQGRPKHLGEHARQRSAWETSKFIVTCFDGKARRIEPGSFPLAHGIPARVGRLRGYGNAIVPQVAATFIQASGFLI
jgi:DNA (cytosine-5)-methyltransferase 1